MKPLQAFRASTSPSSARRTLAAIKDYAKLCKSQDKPVPAHLQAVLGLDATALSGAIEKNIGAWAGDYFAGLHAAWTDAVPLIAARLPMLTREDWYSKPEFLLCEAAIHGSAQVITWLVEHGADPSARDDAGGHGHTALHWAVYQGQAKALKALCAAPGVDYSRTSRHGDTALSLSVSRSPKMARALVTVLLKHGANPNEGGSTLPLAIATTARQPELVECLLAADGIDVDAIDRKTGATALQLAAAFGVEEVARRLLEAGAQRTAKTKRKLEARLLRDGQVEQKSYPSGLTAAQLAKAAGLAELARALA